MSSSLRAEPRSIPSWKYAIARCIGIRSPPKHKEGGAVTVRTCREGRRGSAGGTSVARPRFQVIPTAAVMAPAAVASKSEACPWPRTKARDARGSGGRTASDGQRRRGLLLGDAGLGKQPEDPADVSRVGPNARRPVVVFSWVLGAIRSLPACPRTQHRGTWASTRIGSSEPIAPCCVTTAHSRPRGCRPHRGRCLPLLGS